MLPLSAVLLLEFYVFDRHDAVPGRDRTLLKNMI